MTAITREALVGGWRLVSAVQVFEDGETRDEFGTAADGYLAYTEQGTVSAVLGSTARQPVRASDPQDADAEDYAGMARLFLAYAGRFTVDSDDGDVTHHIDIALFPNWQGRSQPRKLVLVGDRLVIRSSARRGADGRAFSVDLHWRRERRLGAAQGSTAFLDQEDDRRPTDPAETFAP